MQTDTPKIKIRKLESYVLIKTNDEDKDESEWYTVMKNFLQVCRSQDIGTDSSSYSNALNTSLHPMNYDSKDSDCCPFHGSLCSSSFSGMHDPVLKHDHEHCMSSPFIISPSSVQDFAYGPHTPLNVKWMRMDETMGSCPSSHIEPFMIQNSSYSSTSTRISDNVLESGIRECKFYLDSNSNRFATESEKASLRTCLNRRGRNKKKKNSILKSCTKRTHLAFLSDFQTSDLRDAIFLDDNFTDCSSEAVAITSWTHREDLLCKCFPLHSFLYIPSLYRLIIL